MASEGSLANIQVVGVIGLGQMGLTMATNLSAKGFRLLGHDVSAERRDAAAEKGIALNGLADIAGQSAIVILSLPLAAHVTDVVEGRGGLLAHMPAGSIIIDTSTSEPGVSRRLAASAEQRGIGFLDAPVSGGPAGAAAGTLTVMVGGSEAHVRQAAPVLEAMAAKIIHVGSSGAGNVVKLVNNMLVAAHLLTVSEAMRLAESAGVRGSDALRAVNAASGRSAVSEVNYSRWIFPEAFDSGFTMGLMRKDVRLAIALAAETGSAMPVSELAARIWQDSAAYLTDAEDFNRIVVQPLRNAADS